MPYISADDLAQQLAQARRRGFAEGLDAAFEARADAAQNLEQDDSEWADERRGLTMTGCGLDDTVDSRGRPLRPRVNDAGEPCWM